jgi:hypothetical protein
MKRICIFTGSAALAVSLAVWTNSAGAAAIAQHSGSTDPSTEGFVNNGGSLPVYGSAVTDAWNVSGDWSTTYNEYLLAPAQSAELWSEKWTLTAVMQNLSTAAFSGI